MSSSLVVVHLIVCKAWGEYFVDAGDLNSGPDACIASPLLTKPFLLAYTIAFKW